MVSRPQVVVSEILRPRTSLYGVSRSSFVTCIVLASITRRNVIGIFPVLTCTADAFIVLAYMYK